MKKTYTFFIIGLIIIFSLAIGYFFLKNNNGKQISNNSNTTNFSYDSTRVSKNTNSTSEVKNDNIPKENKQEEPKSQETEISDFTTKIYTKDSDRQNNISITCSSLNDTFVENGSTFSFCDTVGKATSSKGYEKADVYKDGEVVQALGGGNCQVSSTLYNAVLKVDDLNVTERHEHSNTVPYVSKGKDAAVAYGSYDLKFVNNTRK